MNIENLFYGAVVFFSLIVVFSVVSETVKQGTVKLKQNPSPRMILFALIVGIAVMTIFMRALDHFTSKGHIATIVVSMLVGAIFVYDRLSAKSDADKD